MRRNRRAAALAVLTLTTASIATGLGMSRSMADTSTVVAGRAPGATHSSTHRSSSPNSSTPSTGVAASVWQLGGLPLNVRQSPSRSARVVGTLREGQRLTIACQTRAESVTNDVASVTSDLWDYVPEAGGWVADAWVWTGTDARVAPVCSTSPGRPVQTGAPGRPVQATSPGRPVQTGTPANQVPAKQANSPARSFVVLDQLQSGTFRLSNCGPTSVLMVLVARGVDVAGYHGPDDYGRGIDTIQQGIGSGAEGTGTWQLHQAVTGYGLTARTGTSDAALAALKKGKLVISNGNGVVLPPGVDGGHHIVLRGYRDGMIQVADPNGGREYQVSEATWRRYNNYDDSGVGGPARAGGEFNVIVD